MTRVPVDLLSALRRRAEAFESPGLEVRINAAREFADASTKLHAWARAHRVRTLVDEDLHEAISLAVKRFHKIMEGIAKARSRQAERAEDLRSGRTPRLVRDATGYLNLAPSEAGGELLVDIEPASRVHLVAALCRLASVAGKKHSQEALAVIKMALRDERPQVRQKALESVRLLPWNLRTQLRK